MKYIYFFADHPFDIAGYLGIMNVIREERQDCHFTLIIDSHPNLRRYELEAFFPRFDAVVQVGFCSYGGFQKMAKVVRFSRELRRLNFKPYSVLFIQSGRQLISNVLLKRLEGERMKTVWITQHDHIDLEDAIIDYKKTFLCNFYHLFFGKSYVDIYKARNSEKEPISYFHHRKIPYDFVFYVSAPHKSNELKEDELYFPYYFPDRLRKGSKETIVLCGSMFKNRPWIKQDRFVWLYNELIELIRKKHAGASFIYLPHPREKEDWKSLDLTDFNIELSINSELLFMINSSISTVYSVWSTASATASLFGINGYLLYPLFREDCFGKERRKHFDSRYSKLRPEMFIRSIDEWMTGGNDYNLNNTYKLIKSSVVKMLKLIGLF